MARSRTPALGFFIAAAFVAAFYTVILYIGGCMGPAAYAAPLLPPRGMDVPSGLDMAWDFKPTVFNKGSPKETNIVCRDFLTTPANQFGQKTTGVQQLIVCGWARHRGPKSVPRVSWGVKDDIQTDYFPIIAATNTWFFYSAQVLARDYEPTGEVYYAIYTTNMIPNVSRHYSHYIYHPCEHATLSEQRDEWGNPVHIDYLTEHWEPQPPYYLYYCENEWYEDVYSYTTNWTAEVTQTLGTNTIYREAQSCRYEVWIAPTEQPAFSWKLYRQGGNTFPGSYYGGFLNLNFDDNAEYGAEWKFWAWKLLAIGEHQNMYRDDELKVRRDAGFALIPALEAGLEIIESAGAYSPPVP
jgi:hypothetical protein